MSEPRELAQALAAPFDHTQKLPKGGVKLDYLSTKQVVERLQETLGLDGWQFEVREHGADDRGLWVLGRLTVYLPERILVREQFGECSVTGGMGAGDARKGAASDALKKCASLLGVGLYLARDEWEIAQERAGASTGAGAGERGCAPTAASPAAAAPAPDPQAWADRSPLSAGHLSKREAPRVTFTGNVSQRGQQFLEACQRDLNLDVGAISKALGGVKVADYAKAADLTLEGVYERLWRLVHLDEPIPPPMSAVVAVSAAVQALQDDLVRA